MIRNQEIIIFLAVKGSAVVVIDRLEYFKEDYRQLSDRSYHRQLDKDPTETYRIEIQNAVEDLYQTVEIGETVGKRWGNSEKVSH